MIYEGSDEDNSFTDNTTQHERTRRGETGDGDDRTSFRDASKPQEMISGGGNPNHVEHVGGKAGAGMSCWQQPHQEKCGGNPVQPFQMVLKDKDTLDGPGSVPQNIRSPESREATGSCPAAAVPTAATAAVLSHTGKTRQTRRIPTNGGQNTCAEYVDAQLVHVHPSLIFSDSSAALSLLFLESMNFLIGGYF